MTQWDGFPTPETIPALRTVRLLAIPADRQFVAAVGGALHRLTDPEQWKQVGAVTPDEAAYAALLMIREYWETSMIGMIVPYATTNPPPYTLPCDGSTFYKGDYPALYQALDPAFILNADQFQTPDLRGKMLLGANPSHPVGSTGGEETHTLTVDEMPTHSHTDLGHTHTEGIALPSVAGVGLDFPVPSATPSPGITGIGMANIQPTGGNLPHNNLPPFLALKYAICYA